MATKAEIELIFNETLEERVEHLAALFRELDDDYSVLAKKLNDGMLEAQDRLKQKIDIELISLRNEIKSSLVDVKTTLADIRKRFADRVQDEVRKVTSDEIAESLTKKVLVTRPATREELKDSHTVAVRQATSSEIRNQSN